MEALSEITKTVYYCSVKFGDVLKIEKENNEFKNAIKKMGNCFINRTFWITHISFCKVFS